jgi:4-hydroxybenzoate polyprenyltransferase
VGTRACAVNGERRSWAIDYLFLLRPTLLIPVWTLLLLGYYRATALAGHPLLRLTVSGRLVWTALLYSALMGAVYIINQIFDRETDFANEKLFLLSHGYIPLRSAVVMVLLLAVPAFVGGLAAGVDVALLFLVSFVLGVLYSVPPVKLKGRPVLDLAANSLGYGLLAFTVGWTAASSISMEVIVYALPYVLAVGAVFVNTTVPDISGDRASGDRTTGVVLGPAASTVLSLLLLVACLVVSLIVQDRICTLAAVLALPFFVAAAFHRGERRAALLSIRISAPVLVVVTAVIFPAYFIVLVVTYSALRWYYRRRFGIVYPSLRSD